MTAKFDDDVKEIWNENGEFVYCDWLRDQADAPPVRVDVGRMHVRDVWQVDWNDEAAMRSAFNLRKKQHLQAALRAAGYRVYRIG
jgi:hypothetical protein